MSIKSIFLIVVLSMSTSLLQSQDRKKDTIDNQVVNVIKPYTPTVSEAFKIKDVPKLKDSSSIEKRPVKYNIFSIPVASTFTPAKGKAANVDKAPPLVLFDNYASLGLGSYTTLLGEVFLNHQLSSDENVGGYFSHHSSQGGIDGLILDDDFSKTILNAFYSQDLRDFSWKLTAGFDLQTYNWYGLPQDIFAEAATDGIDPGHAFNSFNVGGKLSFDDALIKDGSVLFRRFGDNQGSGENRFLATADFDIPINREAIFTEFYVDYINGSFDNTFNSNETIKYSNMVFGLSPSYQLKEDDLTIDLGIRLVYLNDIETGSNEFFVYPNIDMSYRLVSEILIAYGGITGGLIQNSYHQFANENPFVSPTLFIAPTDQVYKGFAGVKGKLSNNVSYSIKGSYFSEENKALFVVNDAQTSATRDYQFGNSFGLVYDDVRTFSVDGELNIDINRNFTLGLKGAYFNYATDQQDEAWNLPDITGSIFIDFQISEQWSAGASAFFVGERLDRRVVVDSFLPTVTRVQSLESYFDLNAHVGYRINDQFTVYLKGNNLLNQDYERYLNFPVQGLQVVAGATYQFDF